MEPPIMSYIFIGILLSIMELDVRLMKRVNPGLFLEHFSISRLSLWAMSLALALLAVNVDPANEGLLLGIMAGVLPFQLYYRQKFLKTIKENFQQIDHKAWLAFDAYGVILHWFLLTGLFSFLIDGVFEYVFKCEQGLWQTLVSSITASLIMVILIAQASGRFNRGNFWKNVGFNRGRKPLPFIIITSVVLAVFFGYLSVSIILARHGQPVTPLSKLLDANQSLGALLFFLVLAVVFAPLAEEIIFRGYFFEVLKNTKGKFWAIIVVALSFAGLHLGQYWNDWGAIVMITILGFVLTLLRFWSGTTLASTIMHYVYNAAVTIIPVFMIMSSNPAYLKYSTMYPSLDQSTKENLLKESIQKQPDLSQAYNDLAWIYAEQKKNLGEALDFANKAVTLDPNIPEYLDTKAEVLFQLKRYDEALAISQGLLRTNIDTDLKNMQNKRILEIETLQKKL
jgi:membrane protease YdiL (CAAX protease family)